MQSRMLQTGCRVIRIAAGLAAFGLLAWLGWNGANTRQELEVAAGQAVRVAELRGVIAHLDEWLTMSARMAAATGNTEWIARYDEADPRLDAAIAEAISLATPGVARELERTTDDANHRLVAMERASFAYVMAGDRPGASALLDSPEYAALKRVYADGITTFGRDLKTLALDRAAALNRRAWVEGAGLGLGVLLLIAALLAQRSHARTRAMLALTQATARTDPLTGLPNRRHVHEALEEALAGIAGSGDGVAVMMLDLDRFKAVNDVYGHAAGDELLRLIAARLQGAARAGDFVARLGGDEFALIVPLGTAPAQGLSGCPAASLAQRIVAAIGQPFNLSGGVVAQIGTSVGIAVAPADGADVGALIRRADIALYRSKAGGRNSFQFFEAGMDAALRERALMEAELRQAIVDGTIVPHFQPLVQIGSGALVGFELLARWPHPLRGLVPPAEFIPIAEEVGLIGPLTARMLAAGCRAAAGWPAHLTLACNVSPLQLRDLGLPDLVRSALASSGLHPGRLELEITENALVGDLELARVLLHELKALGVQLAIDDFGTGYSSLRQLQNLPFDKVKIDGGFIGTMATSADSSKIVAAVIGLSHSLGLPTVAEGVEEAGTARLLQELGCDVGQGWLFGRPIPAEGVDALLLADRLLVPAEV